MSKSAHSCSEDEYNGESRDARTILKKLALNKQKLSGEKLSIPPDDRESQPSYSSCNGETDCLPGWYEQLSDDHESVFKEIFEMLDPANTGTLNAESLYEGLLLVDNEITREEVEQVLSKLDKDGNGEIDFDEFLFHMTTLGDDEGIPGSKGKKKFTKRQKLFYSAITQFSLKKTLIDGARLVHMHQAPHVLSHYTAGMRLIGLTDRQLSQHLKSMQKAVGNVSSPYAKPLIYSVFRGSKKRMSKVKARKLPTKKRRMSHMSPDKMAAHEEKQTQKLQTALKLMANRGSIVASLPDAHLFMQIRTSANMPKMTELAEVGSQLICDPDEAKKKCKGGKKCGIQKGWTIPQIQQDIVPLPVLKIKYKGIRPTIEDLPNIREKTAKAMSDYYHCLRLAFVENAFDHWDKLYANSIKSKKLQDNFREVYNAYSPHKEEEVFVLCPWFPERYQSVSARHHSASARHQSASAQMNRHSRDGFLLDINQIPKRGSPPRPCSALT